MRRKDFNVIKKSFENEGGILLTTVYKNNRQKLKYICSAGHSCSITWHDWQSGRRCNICSTEKGVKKRRMDFSIIKSNFEKEGFRVITVKDEYKNNDQRLNCICSNGHEHSISWHNWKGGWRCPHCSNSGVSKWEREVKMYVSNLNINYISNYRNKGFLCSPDTGKPLEFDLWFSKLNKAIECNGIYWHSLDRRHFLDGIKQQFCNKSNIELLVITDQEWNDDIKFCKSKIQNFLSI